MTRRIKKIAPNAKHVPALHAKVSREGLRKLDEMVDEDVMGSRTAWLEKFIADTYRMRREAEKR